MLFSRLGSIRRDLAFYSISYYAFPQVASIRRDLACYSIFYHALGYPISYYALAVSAETMSYRALAVSAEGWHAVLCFIHTLAVSAEVISYHAFEVSAPACRQAGRPHPWGPRRWGTGKRLNWGLGTH